ncbi:MAG: hypothetical protein U5K33_02630 [Halofilum sp. (in: g-proteobacteria)]|nr:hypothetical protein [Halofilum sp. (in: g-proteobacteria)]
MPAAQAGGDPVASLPLESMRGKRASGAPSRSARLSARGIEARNAELRLRLDDGLLTARAAGRRHRRRVAAPAADASTAARTRPPSGSTCKLAAIQSAPLIRALAGRTPVSGSSMPASRSTPRGADARRLDRRAGRAHRHHVQ